MRVSIVSIVSLTLALTNFVYAHSDDTLHAREYVDELSVRDVGDALADISTRDLMSELSERLERRERIHKCPLCPSMFMVVNTFDEHLRKEHPGYRLQFNTPKPKPKPKPKRRYGQLEKCPHCFRQFVVHNNLKDHVGQEHPGSPPL
ncbi:hypothetical protein D9611_012259 [Ephemerocybe angulata]|uniref:C2H2-type domain-containing protein n=1 Tax=Ephemerocybe angulata TaxID=980116 RepID=A0A8H5AT93_9AGAR|nr:hypothetical protein D9611_012259 [Tulosesus angulatus]